MKDEYALAIVTKFKYSFRKTILHYVVSIFSSSLIILLCFSDGLLENRKLMEQIESSKKKFSEVENELKTTIEKLKTELSNRPKIQPTTNRSRDLADGKGSV